MDTITTLGQHIRRLREDRDFSLRELATKLGVSAAFLSDVELGRRHPSDKVLAHLARLLGTSVEDLQKHDTRPPIEEIRRLSTADPVYGLAFRRLLDNRISAEELLRIAEEVRERAKHKNKNKDEKKKE